MKAWEDNIRKVVPYTPGEQPKDTSIIKLNTNENPYPPARGVIKAIRELNEDTLKLYPDPTSSCLTGELSRYFHIDNNQVFVGVGSDDVLAIAFMTFFNSKKPILFPDITYSFYPVWADLYRIPYELKSLDNNFRIVREDFYGENGGIIIANPNAPTSVYEDLDCIEDIVKHNQDVIIIIDEAYIDFAGKSAMELVSKYDNLLVIQTFSKSRSMAGMRIGYAIGSASLIKAMNDVKYSINSYTMNQPSLYAGVESIKDDKYFKSTIDKVLRTRERIGKELRKLSFDFPESGANFLFIRHDTIAASDIFMALKEANIYVRYFNIPRIDNYLRVTIGTDDEMDKVLEFLRIYLSQ